VPLDAKLSHGAEEQLACEKESRNVVGVLPGSETRTRRDLHGALGPPRHAPDGETGDNIYNGAVDNATGVAALMELAEAFAKSPTPPEAQR
jgi:Zn-dependent M28 family amino/carboxypeptidase